MRVRKNPVLNHIARRNNACALKFYRLISSKNFISRISLFSYIPFSRERMFLSHFSYTPITNQIAATTTFNGDAFLISLLELLPNFVVKRFYLLLFASGIAHLQSSVVLKFWSRSFDDIVDCSFVIVPDEKEKKCRWSISLMIFRRVFRPASLRHMVTAIKS